MLTNTFCHVAGIGDTTERRLWTDGVQSWEDGLAREVRLPPRARFEWRAVLQESLVQFSDGNLSFFAGRLRAKQHWRLYRDFQHSCAFVDIETTGLGLDAPITTIALYDGREIRTYVQGRNLDQFPNDISHYKLLVTYNGKSFDVPIMERTFGIRLTPAHIDLRYVLGALGLKGGLKGCERRLGLTRPGLEEVDGMLAVSLWYDYRRGNERALETLLAYNVQDVLSLHTLVVYAHNQHIQAMPFAATHGLPLPEMPVVPFRPDRATVARLTGAQFQWQPAARPLAAFARRLSNFDPPGAPAVPTAVAQGSTGSKEFGINYLRRQILPCANRCTPGKRNVRLCGKLSLSRWPPFA